MAKIDYPTQMFNQPFLDPRTFGAQGNGTHDDTPHIQAALDLAGTNGYPNIVQLTGGANNKFLCKTALKFKKQGIILRGNGMAQYGTGAAGFTPARLIADNAHDSTPMVQMDPADGALGAWIYGSIQDLCIDVSASSVFNSGGSPPAVVNLRGISNCTEFRNIFVYGHTGTALRIGDSGSLISENNRFVNMYLFGGYNAGGTSLSIPPVSAGIIIEGSDNTQIIGGMVVYDYIGLPVNGNTSDIAAIQLLPNSVNILNNGVVLQDIIMTRYACNIRLTNVNNGGTIQGPQNVRINNCAAETYGRFLVANEEISTNYGGSVWRSQVDMKGCFVSGAFGGSNSRQVYLNHCQSSEIHLQYLTKDGDLYIDSDCVGVRYCYGNNPSSLGLLAVYSPTDLGDYTVFGVSQGSYNSQFANVRARAGSPVGTMGQLLDMVLDTTTGKLWMCTSAGGPSTGGPPNAVWKGVTLT